MHEIGLPGTEQVGDDGRDTGRHPGVEDDDEEEHRERERQRGERLRGDLPAVVGVHHVEHGVEEKSHHHRQGNLPDEFRYRFRREIVIGIHRARYILIRFHPPPQPQFDEERQNDEEYRRDPHRLLPFLRRKHLRGTVQEIHQPEHLDRETKNR